uniref:Uncharacterized protein n=1 Tax=viral metagenome TaxID=1070528 RepID=A0A6M3MAH2_9ZZZZ
MICQIGKIPGGDLFNLSHKWFLGISKPSEAILDAQCTIRFRGFGNDNAKQAAWDKDWRSKHPEWGPVSQCTVSGFPIEVWFDIRETDSGLLLAPHLVGHETIHAIALKSQVVDPDTFAKMNG